MQIEHHSGKSYGSTMERLRSLVKARIPLIWVITHEESRFIREFNVEVAGDTRKELWTWSVFSGLQKYKEKEQNSEFKDSFNPTKALSMIASYRPRDDKGAIYIMKDMHTVMQQPIPRQIRDLYQTFINEKKTLVMLSPSLSHGDGGGRRPGLEPTLEKQIVVVEYELPERHYIEQKIRNGLEVIRTQRNPSELKSQIEYSDEDLFRFSQALQGLTEVEVNNAIGACLTSLNRIDERRLLLEKKQVIKRSDILEYVEQAPAMSDVGGLDVVKDYFQLYGSQFTDEAKEFGIEPLRGVLLTGVPGTGKSLCAKAIAALWNLPLLRLDVGKVMTGLVGGSEEKMRSVIQQAEAISPCILWIDEIEKSLSGTKSSNFSDGGTMSRVFGTLLTAMEERFDGVVTIATANDIQALPPELIRRFDEVFFVDLPAPAEREEIFKIHLRKRGRDPKKLKINLEKIVTASHRYTGSEIEKSVKEAMIRAFHDGKREITTEDILISLKGTKAIAIVMDHEIDKIRAWARDHARYASTQAAELAAPGKQKVTTKTGKELDLASDLDDIEEVTTPKEDAAMAGFESVLDD